MTQESSYVQVEKKGEGVVLLTFNRPDRLNAFTAADRNQLVATLKQLQEDDTTRVVILTGAGRAFCAGADIVTQRPDTEYSARERYTEPIASWMREIDAFEKPLIAAVNGVAAGSGLSLALACDIRIASETARFVAAWVDIGLVPDAGASFYLPRTIGFSKAAELTFTGKPVDALSGLSMGLVSQVVRPDELTPASIEIASVIARKAPITVRLAKRTLRLGSFTPLDQSILHESHSQRICGMTEDSREAMTAFRERRRPVFKGR